MFSNDELTWSFTKYSIFENCERKYFYTYIESKNGWSKFGSNNIEKEIYKLKHAISYKDWTRNIFNEALLQTFYIFNSSSGKHFYNVFVSNLNKKFFYDKQIILNKSDYDKKPILIKELLHNKLCINDLFEIVEILLYKINRILIKSNFFEKLSSIPLQSKKIKKGPLSFYLNGIKIYCSPLLCWLDKGIQSNLNTNIFFSSKSNTNWSLISSVNSMYWHNTSKIDFGRINTMTLFIDVMKEKNYIVHTKRNINETKELIRRNFNKINSRTTYNGKSIKNNYLKTNDIKICKSCSFKQVCIKEP